MSWSKLSAFIVILFISIIICDNFTLSYAQDEVSERVIEAEGIAPVSGDSADALIRARDEALKNALRRAIEEGVGTIIDSESIAQNFQLLNDEIYSEVKGYVRDYKIISDNNGINGIYKIMVKTTVALGLLQKDVQALNIIKKEKGNPRVIVILNETVDGLPSQNDIARAEIEKVFLSNNFPMVDKSQFGAIQQRDATLNYADPRKAAALGRRFGAEVVIVGEASSNLVDSSEPYGVPVFFYQANVSVRAINVDTASVIASENIETDWRKRGEGQASGRMESAKHALKAGGAKIGEKMINLITEKWRSEVYNTVSIQIVAENVNSARRRNFKNELKSIRGVNSVDERDFANQVMTVDVEVDGALFKDFDERLEDFKTVGVEVTGKTQNRIDVKLFDKP